MDYNVYILLKKQFSKEFLDLKTIEQIHPQEHLTPKIRDYIRRHRITKESFYSELYLANVSAKDYDGYRIVYYHNNKIVILSTMDYINLSQESDGEYFTDVLELYANPEINNHLLQKRNMSNGLIYIKSFMTYSAFQGLGLMEIMFKKILFEYKNYMFFLNSKVSGYWHLTRGQLRHYLEKFGFKSDPIVDKFLENRDYMFKY
jgi:hypothetical protein